VASENQPQMQGQLQDKFFSSREFIQGKKNQQVKCHKKSPTFSIWLLGEKTYNGCVIND